MSGFLNGEPIGDFAGQIWHPDGELLTVKHAVINASTIGDNTIVSAVASRSILVLSVPGNRDQRQYNGRLLDRA